MERDMTCPYCQYTFTTDVHVSGPNDEDAAWWYCPYCKDENELPVLELFG